MFKIKIFTSHILCIFLISVEYVQADSLGGVTLGITRGIASSGLDWSIGGEAPIPNVLSQLQWKDLKVDFTTLNSEIWFENSVVIASSFSRGQVVSGSVRDSDYLLDDRQAEFSRSISKAGGSVESNSVSVGFRQLYLNSASGQVVSLTPQLGYRSDRQQLTATEGKQVILGVDNVLNPQLSIDGLNSSYKTEWRGPWLGLEYRVHGETQQLIAMVKFHKMRYQGLGNWNLRSDLQHPVSFEHTAKARGISLDIDYERRLAKNIWGKLKVSYQVFKTNKGDDKTFFANGSSQTIDLQESRWRSLGLQLGAVVRF